MLLDSSSSKETDQARNIFLLDHAGRVIWQVEAATISHGIKGFSDLYLGADGDLLAYSPNGIEYTIQVETGRILKRELIR